MIRSTHFVYAQQLKMAWDVKNWDWKSSKANCPRVDRSIGFPWIIIDSWKIKNNNNQCLLLFYNFVSSKVC
jgi:hypothetical protein